MITRQVYVTCDECVQGSEPCWTTTDARAAARAQGWKRRAGRDLCPECLEPTDSEVKR